MLDLIRPESPANWPSELTYLTDDDWQNIQPFHVSRLQAALKRARRARGVFVPTDYRPVRTEIFMLQPDDPAYDKQKNSLRGLRIAEDVRKNQVLGIYRGVVEYVTDGPTKSLYIATVWSKDVRLRDFVDDKWLLAGLTFEMQIDSERQGNEMRFINGVHWDDPRRTLENVELRPMVDPKTYKPVICLIALEDIPAGSEALLNYGKTYWESDHEKEEEWQLKRKQLREERRRSSSSNGPLSVGTTIDVDVDAGSSEDDDDADSMASESGRRRRRTRRPYDDDDDYSPQSDDRDEINAYDSSDGDSGASADIPVRRARGRPRRDHTSLDTKPLDDGESEAHRELRRRLQARRAAVGANVPAAKRAKRSPPGAPRVPVAWPLPTVANPQVQAYLGVPPIVAPTTVQSPATVTSGAQPAEPTLNSPTKPAAPPVVVCSTLPSRQASVAARSTGSRPAAVATSVRTATNRAAPAWASPVVDSPASVRVSPRVVSSSEDFVFTPHGTRRVASPVPPSVGTQPPLPGSHPAVRSGLRTPQPSAGDVLPPPPNGVSSVGSGHVPSSPGASSSSARVSQRATAVEVLDLTLDDDLEPTPAAVRSAPAAAPAHVASPAAPAPAAATGVGFEGAAAYHAERTMCKLETWIGDYAERCQDHVQRIRDAAAAGADARARATIAARNWLAVHRADYVTHLQAYRAVEVERRPELLRRLTRFKTRLDDARRALWACGVS